MMTLWKKVFRYQIPSYLVNTLHIQNYVPISEIVFQYFHFFLACVIFNLEHLEAWKQVTSLLQRKEKRLMGFRTSLW